MDSQTTKPDTAQQAPIANASATAEQPWYAAYPPARSEPQAISRHDVLQLLKSETTADSAFVLVDLRRTDYEGGTILESINLPAQSLHPTIPSLYKIFSAAGVRQVIWYCGSSRGRGTRAASWFADYLNEQGDAKMKSLVLSDGIKGWVAEKGVFVRYMQEYDESKWT
ncbi:uncharacterized protein LTR77_011251 [Saxophila tyrrhenica]|uniref:Rhodanese domain-containing protein n=1 Tax=Saxophila tyrrhenica TaxID=1690608 RepID=A0AAV9NWP4_9PEZI|nr:hypothetical protein LTR77_011251 [Saxophila tyrrhenica]